MKSRVALFVLLSIINVVAFIFRDHFQYIPYSTYAELYSECNSDCVEKWDDFTLAYTEDEWAEARRTLAPLHLDTGSTLSKAERIGHHLYSRFCQQAGFPSDTIHKARPMVMYNILSADTAQKLFCGTYALMFNFFCWAQGIVCRNVEIYRPDDHHVLNEVYLPEKRQWILMDLTSNILNVQNSTRLLNTRDFVETWPSNADLTIIPAGDATPVSFTDFAGRKAIEHYYGRNYPYYYYHATQAETVYKTGNKLKRYFVPEGWYEVYSPTKPLASLFYLRLFFAAAWLILGGMIVFKLFGK